MTPFASKLFYSRSLVLTTSVAVVLERDALLLNVVDKLYASVLHRSCGSYVLVAFGSALVHLTWEIGRAGADALVRWH